MYSRPRRRARSWASRDLGELFCDLAQELECSPNILGARLYALRPQCHFEAQNSRARGLQVPDTEEQSEWLLRHQAAIALCHLERRDW
jgi:hypothetical protein